MNTPRTLIFSAVVGLCLTGCNIRQENVASSAEDCQRLVTMGLIGLNGPEVCVTTPLSKSDTSISGTIVGVSTPGPFMVTALTSDGDILKQVTTQSNGDFAMVQLNLQNLPSKNISFSVFVNSLSSPPTKLVVGQEPATACGVGTPGFPSCGTCLLYTSPSPRDGLLSRMPSSA